MIPVLVGVDVDVDVDLRLGQRGIQSDVCVCVCVCEIQFVLVLHDGRALEPPLFGTRCASCMTHRSWLDICPSLRNAGVKTRLRK